MFRWLAKGKRINRATYWTIYAAALVIGMFLHRASIVFSLWTVVASMKRCRDFGWPGWAPWALLGVDVALVIAVVVKVGSLGSEHHGAYVDANSGLVAASGAMIALGVVLILNIVFNIVVGCIPGNAGTNRYGPPPLPGIGKGVDDYGELARAFGDESDIGYRRGSPQVARAARTGSCRSTAPRTRWVRSEGTLA